MLAACSLEARLRLYSILMDKTAVESGFNETTLQLRSLLLAQDGVGSADYKGIISDSGILETGGL